MKHRCDCCQRDSLIVSHVVSLDVSSHAQTDRLCPDCARLVRSERAYRLTVNPFSLDHLKVDLQRRYEAA